MPGRARKGGQWVGAPAMGGAEVAEAGRTNRWWEVRGGEGPWWDSGPERNEIHAGKAYGPLAPVVTDVSARRVTSTATSRECEEPPPSSEPRSGDTSQ